MKISATERALLRLLAAADPDRPAPSFEELGAAIGVSCSRAHQAFVSLEAKGLAYNRPSYPRTARIREGALGIAQEAGA